MRPEASAFLDKAREFLVKVGIGAYKTNYGD